MWTRQLRGTFDQRGVTLTELVVTLALAAIVMAALVAVWSKSQEAYFIGSETAEVQQNVRAALDFMVREIRSTGKDVTNCAFDYATSATFTGADCTNAKRDACRLKLQATVPSYNTCANVFAIPFGTVGGVSVPSETAIAIRADRNDNGTVAGTTNSSASDPGGENVLYRYWAAGNCPGGLPAACITRDDGTGPQAMVSVDISGFVLTYFPKPGFPPCNNTPPQNPCPSFTPADQADADGIGRIRITVTALQQTVGTIVSRTLVTDVILRNRNPNTGT
jgi:prepilin-type N-terminal cleavage/methylation domain-containing protein